MLFKYTGFALPCFFNKLTGRLCPACGISRMIVSALNGDFYAAYGYNKLLFCTLPLIAAVFAAEELRYIKTGQRELSKFSKIFIYAEITLLILFGILRNIL